MMTAEEIIEFFGMRPLPDEGGFYVETYRAQEKIAKSALPKRYVGKRCFATAIIYLITPERFSKLHRLAGDEIFNFYLGGPVTMLQLHADGSSEVITLGQDIFAGQRLQVTVPQGSWQGCFLNEGGEFALMGTTVSPGFEFEDYEPAQRKELLKRYTDRKDLIIRLT